MNDSKRNKQIINILLALLIAITAFLGFGIRLFYIASGILLMTLSILAIIKQKTSKEDEAIYKTTIVWSLYSIFQAIVGHSLGSFYLSFMHIGVIVYFYFMLSRCSNRENYNFFIGFYKIIHFGVLFFLLLISIISKSSLSYYETLIYVGLATIPFFVTNKKQNNKAIFKIILLSIAWAYLSYIIGARAQILSFLIFSISALTIIIISKLRNKDKILNTLFVIFYIILNLFPLCYIWLSTSSYQTVLTNLSLESTSSRFFSGREVLWKNVYSEINSPLEVMFGLGMNRTRDITKYSGMSLHNLYVTIISEGGVLFIILFGVLLYKIWNRLNKSDALLSKITMAMFIAVLFKQSFDISLIENNLCFAIIIWSTISIGCNNQNGNKEIKS